MARKTRITISVDSDIYSYAATAARRRGMSIAEVLRWLLRDGAVFRREREEMYQEFAREEELHGR